MHLVLNESLGADRRNELQPGNGVASRALLTESNHRIANNLAMVAALLRMHARQVRGDQTPLSPDATAAIIDEAGARVDVVAQLHRQLAAGDSHDVNLADYLQQLAEGLVTSTTAAQRMQLSLDCEAECSVSAAQAVRIGFLISELLTNAIKYAHPARGVRGSVELGFRRETGGGVRIWVADDGVGLPDGFSVERDGGLGMRTIRAIAGEINAALSFESTGLGLRATLRIPPVVFGV